MGVCSAIWYCRLDKERRCQSAAAPLRRYHHISLLVYVYPLYSNITACYALFVDDILLDIWSAGCVMAELLLGQPIFPGDSGVDQLVEIIKVLGTPTREQIREMNPSYTEFRFPQIKSHPWNKVSE